MRLSNSSTAATLLDQLQRLSSRQADLQRQVATGQRIRQPGDDPAAAARVVAARMESGAIAQFARNASAALEYSKTSYGGLEQLKKVSDRASELAVLGEGSLDPDAMRAYAAEANQLLEQAAGLGNTRFGNDYVFSGTAVSTQPFALTRDASGVISTVAYAGDSGRLTVPLSESSGIQPVPDAATNSGLADMLNRLVALRDALSSGDAAAVRAVRPGLEDSENLLVGALSEHGAVQLRIEVARVQQKSRADELERQISSEADADITESIVQLNQTTQAYEAALSSSASILKLSLLDYLR
jgi:flagellar hook-associated protein 3 FlgL